jgi:hypothetical protein
MDGTSTSMATTGDTEPEIVAGITSGEGQPERYVFDSTPQVALGPLWRFGAVAAAGLVVALIGGLGRHS